MLGALARSLFGTANDRVVKGFDKAVAKINALEPEFVKLSDEQLRGKTAEFRERLIAAPAFVLGRPPGARLDGRGRGVARKYRGGSSSVQHEARHGTGTSGHPGRPLLELVS